MCARRARRLFPVASTRPFVGLTGAKRRRSLIPRGRRWRTGREDDEWFAVTEDYVVGRVTFELDGDVAPRLVAQMPIPLPPSREGPYLW